MSTSPSKRQSKRQHFFWCNPFSLNPYSFLQFQETVISLKSIPALKSLFINLHEEEQVDLIMRSLTELEFLNGLKVEREILDDDNEEEYEQNIQHNT